MNSLATLVDLPSENLIQNWQDLLGDNPRSTVFQHPQWVLPNIIGAGRPKTLLMRFDRDNGLSGVAPMFIQRRIDSLRHLRFLGGDYEDVVYQPGKEEEAVRSLLQGMRLHKRHWDIANFKSIMPESTLLAPFLDSNGNFDPNPPALADELKGFTVLCEPHHRVAYIKMPKSWEDYEGHLGKKFSWQLGYEERRRLREFKSVEIRTASSETLDSDLSTFFTLHTERRLAKGYSPHFESDDVRTGFTATAKAFLRVGQLRLYTLVLDEKPAGSIYLLTDRNRIYYYGSGFSSQFEKHGPVKALMVHAIKEGIKCGVKEFDFLKGEGDYRSKWATDFRQLHRLYIAKSSLRPWLVLKLKELQPILQHRQRSPEPAYITIRT